VVAATPMLKAMFRGALDAATELRGAYRSVSAALSSMVPDFVRNALANTNAAATAGKVIFYGLAIVVGAVAAAFGVLAAGVALALAPFIAIGSALSDLWGFFAGGWPAIEQGLSAITGFASRALSAVGSFVSDCASTMADWAATGAQAAADWVAGLVNGIKAGAVQAAAAAVGLSADVGAALSKATESASPSKLFMRKGRDEIAAGVAVGITAGKPSVTSAVSKLVSPGDLAAAGNTTTTTTTSKGGNTYQITINAPSGDAQDIRSTLEDWLLGRLEATATQLGGGEVPAPA
jgi:hypothetical protein